MRPKSARHALIARELALIFASYSFLPSVYHTPGVSHVIADGLSRVNDPSKANPDAVFMHPALAQAKSIEVPPRGPGYYITLGGSSSSQCKVVLSELADEMFVDSLD